MTLSAEESRLFSPFSVQGSGAVYISEVLLGPEGRKRRERGSDIRQAREPRPSTAKDCHCLPLLGLPGQDAALRRVMEASRGQRSPLVPIWVLTVFRVFVSHAPSANVDLGGCCALGGMAFSMGPGSCAGTADSFRLGFHWQGLSSVPLTLGS